jgi:hypothetical protein
MFFLGVANNVSVKLGRRQVVRHQVLVLVCVGSNPTGPTLHLSTPPRRSCAGFRLSADRQESLLPNTEIFPKKRALGALF